MIRYNVSYQAAHRIIQELEGECYLHRAQSSGTYVAGSSEPPKGVVLVFHSNTKSDTYGGMLLNRLKGLFDREGIDIFNVSGVVFEDYVPGRYNIMWGPVIRRPASSSLPDLQPDDR